MKRFAFTILALVFVTGTAVAAGPQGGSGIGVDLSLNYASEPAGGFDGTYGFELGGNIDLKRLGASISTSKDVELQGRASLSYYNWDEDFFGEKFELQRIPLFVGGRVVFPAAPQLKVYGQLGLELSFDEIDLFIPGLGKASDDEVNLGITPGVGIIFPVSDQLYLGGNLAWHIIDNDYFTLGVTVGFNL